MTKTALELIQQGWTQRAYARDALGVKVGYVSDDAVCWCSIGAISAVYGNGSLYDSATKHSRNSAIERLEEVIGSKITSWNDHPDRTKEEVVEAFAKAGI